MEITKREFLGRISFRLVIALWLGVLAWVVWYKVVEFNMNRLASSQFAKGGTIKFVVEKYEPSESKIVSRKIVIEDAQFSESLAKTISLDILVRHWVLGDKIGGKTGIRIRPSERLEICLHGRAFCIVFMDGRAIPAAINPEFSDAILKKLGLSDVP